ncbi:MAG: hypothetical protein ACD_7C00514G0001 [uncultured bacterium]|nr:MAG: hypothetical protein ACD_7C00514G0001 [uncultured bacterium]
MTHGYNCSNIIWVYSSSQNSTKEGTMMPQEENQEIPQFVIDGEKLAKAQIVANDLARKLTTFWSAEELKGILEKSLCEINKITH